MRRLERNDVVAEIVEPSRIGAAVLAADLVLVEATAAGAGEFLPAPGSRAAASVAYCSDVPVWAVVGRGRVLPDAGFASLVGRVSDVRVPWDSEADVVPFALATYLATERGVSEAAGVQLAAECPLAQELLASRR